MTLNLELTNASFLDTAIQDVSSQRTLYIVETHGHHTAVLRVTHDGDLRLMSLISWPKKASFGWRILSKSISVFMRT
jgi:hypothetical protein